MESIFQGVKLYELRKTRCKNEVSGIIFYVTAPTKCVIGEALIGDVLEGRIEDVWHQVKGHAGISYEFYKQYYKGKKKAIAYLLKDVKRYDIPRALEHYGLSCPPQSFVYVDD